MSTYKTMWVTVVWGPETRQAKVLQTIRAFSTPNCGFSVFKGIASSARCVTPQVGLQLCRAINISQLYSREINAVIL